MGLCIYVHNNWCTNAKIIDSYCSPDLEYLTIKCRPIYLPHLFTVVVVVVTAVYIPPDANASIALGYLHRAITSHQSMYPEAVHIIAGDFNHADKDKVLLEGNIH